MSDAKCGLSLNRDIAVESTEVNAALISQTNGLEIKAFHGEKERPRKSLQEFRYGPDCFVEEGQDVQSLKLLALRFLSPNYGRQPTAQFRVHFPFGVKT